MWGGEKEMEPFEEDPWNQSISPHCNTAVASYLRLAGWLGGLQLDTAAFCTLQFAGQDLLTHLQPKHTPLVHVTTCPIHHSIGSGQKMASEKRVSVTSSKHAPIYTCQYAVSSSFSVDTGHL